MNKDQINPAFQNIAIDYLYHLGIDTSMDLKSAFGNVRYVIFTLSNTAAQVIADEFARNVYKISDENFSYLPIYKTERFHMYKIGISIIISIGVGMQSLLICLNEITKLLVHLENYDVQYFKVGLCDGIGVADGGVIISNKVVNGKFESNFDSIECGMLYKYPTVLDDTIAHEILEFCQNYNNTNVSLGINLSTNSFYDEQARMNGAIAPLYTRQEANKYLTDAYHYGIRSIDMESLAFASFCNQLDICGCIIGISVVNRLITEDIAAARDDQLKMLAQFAQILSKYIQTKNPFGYK